jgi:hypothetical protein
MGDATRETRLQERQRDDDIAQLGHSPFGQTLGWGFQAANAITTTDIVVGQEFRVTPVLLNSPAHCCFHVLHLHFIFSDAKEDREEEEKEVAEARLSSCSETIKIA